MIKHVLVALIAVSGGSAVAQEQRLECGPRDVTVTSLLSKYGEVVVNSGMDRRGLAEMYANDETGTWTFTITSPRLITCVHAHGQYFTTNVIRPIQGDPT